MPANVLQSPDSWMQAKSVELQYCDRLKVRMLSLPCGQREECNGCERSRGSNINGAWKNGNNSCIKMIQTHPKYTGAMV
jgi:hypothetical protein